jgi:hypothetical protein
MAASKEAQSRKTRSLRLFVRQAEAAEITVKLHAPSTGWFMASLIIAVIAVVGAIAPIPYISAYAPWTAILAYIVLALACLA